MLLKMAETLPHNCGTRDCTQGMLWESIPISFYLRTWDLTKQPGRPWDLPARPLSVLWWWVCTTAGEHRGALCGVDRIYHAVFMHSSAEAHIADVVSWPLWAVLPSAWCRCLQCSDSIPLAACPGWRCGVTGQLHFGFWVSSTLFSRVVLISLPRLWKSSLFSMISQCLLFFVFLRGPF